MHPETPHPPSRNRAPWFAAGFLALVAVIAIPAAIATSGTTTSGSDNAAEAAPATAEQTTTTTTSTTRTTTPTTTTTPPPPPIAEPLYFEGTGDDVIVPDQPIDSARIATFSCPSCSSNTVLRIDGTEGLLVNEIGAYTGTRWINIYDNSLTTQFEIKANGYWTLEIRDITEARYVNGAFSGTGDDVVLLDGNTSTAEITNIGESNFAVHVLSDGSGFVDLAINHIGSYQGTVPLSTPAFVQVTSNGDWTITPQ